MKIEEVKEELQRIKRTHFGISIPGLRKYAMKTARHNYAEFLEINDNSSFELRLMHAFIIGYSKNDIKSVLKDFKNFIPFVNDWAVCDSLCQNFKAARKYPDTVWSFLMKYKNSKKEFESRIVSVMLLSHYLNDEYIDRVIEVINNINTDDYYSQMGAAWAIASIGGIYPAKCLNYLKSSRCRLDKITYNKALQKIRESFRTPDYLKEYAKTGFRKPSAHFLKIQSQTAPDI